MSDNPGGKDRVVVEKWTPYGWDTEKRKVHTKAHFRQYGSNRRDEVGLTVSFDIANGLVYSDDSKGLDRHIMEGAEVEFYLGDFTVLGFVHVERYGPGTPDGPGKDITYEKQRWIVKRAK